MTAKDAIAQLRDEQCIGVTNKEMLAAFTSVVDNINSRLPQGTAQATPESLLTALYNSSTTSNAAIAVLQNKVTALCTQLGQQVIAKVQKPEVFSGKQQDSLQWWN